MKKSELENLIRDIVQEEVRNAMPIILTEVANAISGKKPFLRESVRTTSVAAVRPIQRPQVKPKPQVVSEKKFSSNPVLNAILNETEGGISYDDPSSYPATMMNEGVEMPEGETEDVGVPTNFMQKDYRGFLKKMDKAAQNSRPM